MRDTFSTFLRVAFSSMGTVLQELPPHGQCGSFVSIIYLLLLHGGGGGGGGGGVAYRKGKRIWELV